MSSFKIEGGHCLSGSITPQGAKNEALQVICAVLLSSEKITISNIPNILDVNNLIELVAKMGVEVIKIDPTHTALMLKTSILITFIPKISITKVQHFVDRL